ncbi:hypothetical protein [Leifsonia sp. RAF41]|uniref:hypothetical protein n=1 Tax=Leifsonia sp. RAF41 TaxID=3233056 RepID=UPI003F97B8F0
MKIPIEEVLQEPIARVGFCRAGEARGRFVSITPLKPVFSTMPEDDTIIFDVGFSGPFHSDGVLVDDWYVVALEHSALVDDLRSFEIDWAPDHLKGPVEATMFPDLRPRGGRTRLSSLPGPSYGKAESFEALLALAELACTADRYIEGTGYPGLDQNGFSQKAILSSDTPVEALMAALSAYRYTLAVVPADWGLELTDDIWNEFRSQ